MSVDSQNPKGQIPKQPPCVQEPWAHSSFLGTKSRHLEPTCGPQKPAGSDRLVSTCVAEDLPWCFLLASFTPSLLFASQKFAGKLILFCFLAQGKKAEGIKRGQSGS